jgi:Ca2+ insensitive EF hand
MPKHQGPDLEADRNMEKYDYIEFMSRMAGESGTDEAKSTGKSGVNGAALKSAPSSPKKAENVKPPVVFGVNGSRSASPVKGSPVKRAS